MIKKIITSAIIVGLSFTACQNIKNKQTPNEIEMQKKSKKKDIPFSVIKNYFVNNSVKKISNPKIETIEKFNEIFGMATTMGKEGKPTQIDFSNQYVIAVLKSETDLSTIIEPYNLQRNEKGEIVLSYKYKTGEKQSYSILAYFAIIVSKSEKGNIVLNEIK